jgi:hypothetical protein
MKSTKEVDDNGTIRWFDEKGRLHREDGPAIIMKNGYQAWYKEGKYHRDGGPAIITKSGSKKWFKENNIHRGNGPAVEYYDGRKLWYINGEVYTEEEYKNEMRNIKLNEIL